MGTLFETAILFSSGFFFIIKMDGEYDVPTGDCKPNGLIPPENGYGTPSVIRKKLLGYVGFANLPNQVHRKSVRKGFQFTIMVVGTLLSLETFSLHSLAAHRRVWAGEIDPHKYIVQYNVISTQGIFTAEC